MRFHSSLLQKRNLSMRAQKYNFDQQPADKWTKVELRRAENLLRDGFEMSTFGWKDPRSIFFLDEWSSLVPELYVLFTFRHPVSVVTSLLRRSLSTRRFRWRPDLFWRLLNYWKTKNKLILDYIKRFPKRSALILSPDDLIDRNSSKLLHDIMNDEWGFPLNALDFSSSYDPRYDHSKKFNQWVNMVYYCRPDVKKVFAELNELRI